MQYLKPDPDHKNKGIQKEKKPIIIFKGTGAECVSLKKKKVVYKQINRLIFKKQQLPLTFR